MSHPANQMTLEALRSVPLFASLDDEAARDLRSLLSEEVVPQNTRLFRQGDSGDAMYLIESGRVRISIRDDDKQEVTLAELAQGDFFGEMSIIDGRQRSADAKVIEDSRLAVLSREAFLTFVRKKPDVALEMLSALTDRLRRTDELLRSRVSRNVNEEEQARLTLADRAADIIAEFGGSWKFILAAVFLFNVWVWINIWLAWMGKTGFDPYPFLLLSTAINMLSVLQAPIILMSQNRQSHKDRLRAEIDYQVNLKNELALNEILERLRALEHKYGEHFLEAYDVTKVE